MAAQDLNPSQNDKPKISAQVRAEHARETQRLQELRRRYSILDARNYITSIIHANYEEHFWPMIRVECDLTVVELRDIGRMRQVEGLKACCRLIRAPVIYEEVALTLWQHLASEQSRSASHGSGESRMGAEQEALEKEICAAVIEQCLPKQGKSSKTGNNSSPRKGHSKRKSWYWIKRRKSSLTRIVEAKEPVAQQPKCVMCSGRSELDCKLPADILKEYGILPGRRESWPVQGSPSSDRCNSAVSKNTTSTLSQKTTLSSTGSSSIKSTQSSTRLSLRRSLSYVSGLARRTPHTKTPLSRDMIPSRLLSPSQWS